MDGYRYRIHENTTKWITGTPRSPSRSTLRPTRRKRHREQTKQAHDELGYRTRRTTRRARGQIKQEHVPGERDKKKHKKNTPGARREQRDALRDENNETPDETGNDRKQIGSTRGQLIEARRQGHEQRPQDGRKRRARGRQPRRNRRRIRPAPRHARRDAGRHRRRHRQIDHGQASRRRHPPRYHRNRPLIPRPGGRGAI